MVEDKLSRDERIRLEFMNQAVSISMGTPNKTVDKIITDAKKFEAYIKNGSTNG
jgi:hypothetical protein